MSKVRAGDIIFVRGTSFISKLVRLFDGGSYSHVAIAVSSSHVIETNWYMKSKIVEFNYEDYDIVSLALTDSQRQQVPLVASKLEGIMYDYQLILGYIFKRQLNNPRHLICSELVYLLLHRIGYVQDEAVRDITPNELYKYLIDRGESMS